MLKLNVKAQFNAAAKAFPKLGKQATFIAAVALTRTSKRVQERVTQELPRAFDRPTPFTMRAFYTSPARKSRLWSSVYVKTFAVKGNPADRWLWTQIEGGPRPHKGFEKLLIRNGVMPDGYYAIPTSAAPRDAYGNVPGGYITRLLSQLRASRNADANAKAKGKKREGRKSRGKIYFSVYPGRGSHLPPGIWERIGFGFGSAVRPIFLYTQKQPGYRKRLDFYGISNREGQRVFAAEYLKAVRQYAPEALSN